MSLCSSLEVLTSKELHNDIGFKNASTSPELEIVRSWVSFHNGINSVFFDFTISTTFLRVFFGRLAASGHVFHLSFPELIIPATVFSVFWKAYSKRFSFQRQCHSQPEV